MRLLVFLAVLTPAVALSQPAALPDSNAEVFSEEATADSTTAPSGLAQFSFSALTDSARAQQDRRPQPDPEPEPEVVVLTPTLHVVGTAGVTFLLPIGWDGPVSTSEASLPGYALYTARNETPTHTLSGVMLRVERVTGLNPLLRERFSRGQTAYGYHGATPVGPAAVPEGFGIEVAGPGTGGAVAFIVRGAALWAVSIQAPTATWRQERAAVTGLFSAVHLP